MVNAHIREVAAGVDEVVVSRVFPQKQDKHFLQRGLVHVAGGFDHLSIGKVVFVEPIRRADKTRIRQPLASAICAACGVSRAVESTAGGP